MGLEEKKRRDEEYRRENIVLMFLSASYLVFLPAEWNIMFVMGTLIVYYTVIDLHGDRK